MAVDRYCVDVTVVMMTAGHGESAVVYVAVDGTVDVDGC